MASFAKHENCNEHQTTMFSSLHEKQKVGKYCDVLLKCTDSDQTFNAHSCVLSASSAIFDKLLQDSMDEREKNPSSDDSFLKLTVNLPSDVASSCVESLLNFIYSGNVDLNIKKDEPVIDKQEKTDNTGRKTRRSSGSTRTKSIDSDTGLMKDESGIEISSLYDFLKASRCLGIKTLTEHLESAATLAKMKIGSSTNLTISERPPRRASAVKFQNALRSSIEEEKGESSVIVPGAKSQKGKKKRQALDDKPAKSPKGKSKSVKKKVTSLRRNVSVENNDQDELNRLGPDDPYKPEKSPENDGFPMPDDYVPVLESRGTLLPVTPECSEQYFHAADAFQPEELVEASEIDDQNGSAGEEVEKTTSETKSRRRKSAHPNQVTDTAVDHSPDETSEHKVEEEEAEIQTSKPPIFKKKRKKTSSSSHTGQNKRRIHEDYPQTCDKCGKICRNSSALSVHMRSHARPDIPCNFCEQKFKYKSVLRRHLTWHTGDGQSCSVCKVALFSQKEYQQHASAHSLKKMRTQCTLCQKWFTSSYVMQLHMRTHTGDELFSCEICKKKFPYKSSLKMHMLLHTGEKPYMCSHCGKSFTQKIHAKEHELQHTGYKRFVCVYCQRYFAHKCGLTRHISDIHHRNRPFVCETCGKSFPRKTKLIEHTRIHTGEKPYVCDICGMKYKANRSLKSHKKNKHKIDVPNFEVGIWRKGPLPPSPHKTKSEEEIICNEQGEISTFSFPIDSESMEEVENAKEAEENILNNIAKEVDVIATDSTDQQSSHNASPASDALADSPPQPSTYPTPQHGIHEAHGLPETPCVSEDTSCTPLPPAASFANASLLPTFPSLQDRAFCKTYIVPLNAAPAFPVLTEQPQGNVEPGQVSGGMVLTYMMPAQSTIHPGEAQTFQTAGMMEAVSHPLEMSRSASVPPMSTFRRHSTPGQGITAADAIFSQATTQPTLPGMHTFQSASKNPLPLLNNFAMPAGISVFVPTSPPSAAGQIVPPDAESVAIPASRSWQGQGTVETSGPIPPPVSMNE